MEKAELPSPLAQEGARETVIAPGTAAGAQIAICIYRASHTSKTMFT